MKAKKSIILLMSVEGQGTYILGGGSGVGRDMRHLRDMHNGDFSYWGIFQFIGERRDELVKEMI